MNKHTIILAVCIAVRCLLASNVVADEVLVQRLSDAIDSLQQRGSYRWTSHVEASEEGRFRRGPTTGVTERNGMTHIKLSFGPRSTHVVIDGNKAAVTNRDGRWETVSLLDQGYGLEGFAATTVRSVKSPVAEARELASSFTALVEEGDALVGSLAAETANERLASRFSRVDLVRHAQGTASFWITDGLLMKYEIHVEGTVRDSNGDRDVSFRNIVDIEDIGLATLDVPGGATEALQRPLPQPRPRLSNSEESDLLELRGKRDVAVHDPSSIVKCGEEYWFFSTGIGVSSWRSKDLRSWQQGPPVFREIPSWVTDVVPEQRGHFWAPDVIRINDRYLLYYSVSSFGKNTSAIALASSPTLDPDDPAYLWTDHGIVLQSRRENNFNAIDPAVLETELGELWMSFGSFWSGIKLVQLDPRSGMRIAADSPIHSIASHREIEAPHIYQHDGWFYLFVNWGKCCSGVDSTYNIRVGRSRDITGPYLDKDGNDMARGGGTLLLDSEGPYIGPGHASVFRKGDKHLLSSHYYDGTQRGRSVLSIQELIWTSDGWPRVATGSESSGVDAGVGGKPGAINSD